MNKCKFCEREFSTKGGLGNHIRSCMNNPDRNPRVMKKQIWNKGLTKQNHDSIGHSKEAKKKISQSLTGKKLSKETRNKISKSRIKFLEQNPDMVPYKMNHYTIGESYPERYWREVLENNNINFIQEYCLSVYRLDFAIIDKMIDLEIDGEQHYLDSRIIESDKRRTEYLKNNGWEVIRVRWSEFQRLSKEEKTLYVNKLIKNLGV